MPFISKDWRSPGDYWVKTDDGWEKKKILECVREFAMAHETSDIRCENYDRSLNTSWFDENMEEENNENMAALKDSHKMQVAVQPHCHITLKCTREIAGFNGLSDAFKRLDFRNAVHDVRRFNYICKLLDLLISQKLSELSGCAQKVLLTMLEEVACRVSENQQNIHMLNRLLRQLRLTIDCACWGRPLGSTLLWKKHLRTINRILSIASHIQIHETNLYKVTLLISRKVIMDYDTITKLCKQPGDDIYPKLQNIPEECVREILLRLADHQDLENSRAAWPLMARLVDEQRIWRELCNFHFTPQQICQIVEQNKETSGDFDWQRVYHKLRRMYGLREEYAEMLQLCRACRCLFWKMSGHPCIADEPGVFEKLSEVDKASLHIPIPPHAFLQFFSL